MSTPDGRASQPLTTSDAACASPVPWPSHGHVAWSASSSSSSTVSSPRVFAPAANDRGPAHAPASGQRHAVARLGVGTAQRAKSGLQGKS
eukprot:346593-Prymnesium_polylepis.1